ncbi:MAG: DUF4836 family protein [Chitinophagaceae bacterium]
MKLKSIVYVLLAGCVTFLASCSGKNANIPVPKDSGFVVHIDGASLNSKLSWDEIKKSEWYTIASEEVKDDLHKKILDNPEASGIDVKSDAFIFLKVAGSNSYIGFTCSIKDEKAFAAFITKTTENKPIEKKGELSVVRLGEAALTWSSKRVVIMGSSPTQNFDMEGSGAYKNRQPVSEDSLIKFASSIYELKTSESMGSDDRFVDMMKEKGDAHFWVNAGNMYGNALPAVLSLTKASTLFEGNATASTLNFEDGKINIDAKSYYNKELAELYKKYSAKNIDEAMLKKIASSNVAAVVAMNYPPEGLKAFVSLLGVDGLLNVFLADANYSLDDFIKANKGDLMLSVSDFSMGPKEITVGTGKDAYTYTTTKPEVKVLFATSVNNKIAFQKLVDMLSEQLKEKAHMGDEMAGMVSYKLLEDWFVAGNDSVQVNSFSTTNTDQPFIKKISGHPMGGYLDIQKLISGARPSMHGDSTFSKIADESLKFWQDIIFTGGDSKGGATASHIEINLVDQKTNSLKQLNNYLGVMARIFREREKWNSNRDFEEKVIIDTVKAPAAE